MAKNFVQDGDVLTLIAPAGGVTSGVPAEVGDLVVVPLETAEAGAEFSAKIGGVWSLPAANGLAQGVKVSLKLAAWSPPPPPTRCHSATSPRHPQAASPRRYWSSSNGHPVRAPHGAPALGRHGKDR